MLGLPTLEGTNPASRFPCSAIGYEAACYSRIWSEVCHPTVTSNTECTHIFLSHILSIDHYWCLNTYRFLLLIYLLQSFTTVILTSMLECSSGTRWTLSFNLKKYCNSVFKKLIKLICLYFTTVCGTRGFPSEFRRSGVNW